MSKYRRVRAEDEDWDAGVRLEQGHASSTVGAADKDDEYFVSMLWLPDPESRSGYALHGVARKQDKAQRPPLGFGGQQGG